MLPDAPHPALVAYDNAPKDPDGRTPEEVAHRLATVGSSIPHAQVLARFGLPSDEAPIAWEPRAVDDLDELVAEHAAVVVGEVHRFATLGIGELRSVAPRRRGQRPRSPFGALAAVAERAARAGGVLPSPAPRPRVLVLPGIQVFVHLEAARLRIAAVFRARS